MSEYMLPAVIGVFALAVCCIFWWYFIAGDTPKPAEKVSVPIQRVRHSPFVTATPDPVPVAEVEEPLEIAEVFPEFQLTEVASDTDSFPPESVVSKVSTEPVSFSTTADSSVPVATSTTTPTAGVARLRIDVARVMTSQLLAILDETANTLTPAGACAEIPVEDVVRELRLELADRVATRLVATCVTIECVSCGKPATTLVEDALASVFPTDLRMLVVIGATVPTVYILDGETSDRIYKNLHARAVLLRRHLAMIGAETLCAAGVPALHQSFRADTAGDVGADALAAL